MDKNMEYNNFYGYSPYSNGPDGFDPSSMYAEFNPMSQYEQGYMYYKFLTQQLEYKIKCREFEKICNENKENRNERRVC